MNIKLEIMSFSHRNLSFFYIMDQIMTPIFNFNLVQQSYLKVGRVKRHQYEFHRHECSFNFGRASFVLKVKPFFPTK